MIRCIVMTAVVCLAVNMAHAQSADQKYLGESAGIRQAVWAWDKSEFQIKAVPAEYAHASKVIIDRRLDVNADSKKKLKIGLFVSTYRELMLTETIREAVMVNDKKAVQEYSEIAYTQLERKSGTLMDKTTIVYVGVKVIKPNGTVKEINADDVVLTKDQKKNKEAKIAIPDLQEGDIIDYFVTKQTNMSQLNALPDYTFTFFDDAPILHCSMHIEAGKKYAVEYRCYNDAPDFKVTKTEDNGNELSIEKSDIAPIAASRLWMSPYRQLPVARVNILLGYNGPFAGRMNARETGAVYKNQSSDKFIEDKLQELAYIKTNTRYKLEMGDVCEAYYKKLKKSGIPKDSLERELFYLFRFANFFEQKNVQDVERLARLPHINFNENRVTFYLGEFFKNNNFNNAMVYYTSNTGPRLKEILSSGDLSNIISVYSSDSYYGFSNIFATPGYLPYYAENNKEALLVNSGSSRMVNPSSLIKNTVPIPSTRYTENTRAEKLEVSLVPEAMKLHVKRQSVLRGHYKSDEQQRLVLFEDYYNSERKYFNDDKTLAERLSEQRKTRQLAEEIQAVFDNARKENKNSFIQEANSWFDTEVSDIRNFQVNNLGVRHTSPDFVFSSEFDLNGMVKKAATNYIIDIGKLIGSQLKVEGEMRKRTSDIYQPFARSLQYQISFTIPEGYIAEGVDALNKKVENNTGGFSCEAAVVNHALVLNIKKIYRNAFEPVGEWEKMLAFIDASDEWNNSKILIKKEASHNP